ncbi:unnamed protein product [Urochloa decumbens]|uniref:Pollen Ole e 1 allergen and extensin family protein n=1 Tax=Urochloa decumbens TaxID=240449 RepID=A0ABC9FFJ7_9POAL
MASSLTALVAVFVAALLLLLMLSGTEAKFLTKANNITVVGSVYCDACSNNTFSKHSFFLKVLHRFRLQRLTLTCIQWFLSSTLCMMEHILLSNTNTSKALHFFLSNFVQMNSNNAESTNRGDMLRAGARVLIKCSFKVNSTPSEELSLEAERTTDQHGVYKLDVPPVDGFECREGHELRSACRATLLRSSSAACNVPGLGASTQHIALRSRAASNAGACFLNLNALNFRPAKRDAALCPGAAGAGGGGALVGSSLFFWPFLPLFWPPYPAPGGGAAGGTVSFPWPYHVPAWLVPFLRPPFLPFPLYEPAQAPPPPFYRFPPSQEADSRP